MLMVIWMKKNKNLPKLVPVKTRKKEANQPIETNNEIQRLVKIVLIISVLFFGVYGLTVLLTENRTNNTEPTEVEIQYNDILLGNLLNQFNKEYYVLVTTDKDYYTDLYNVYISMYENKKDSLKVYTSNLSNSFNLKYKGEASNTKITNINDLKLSTSTLIKVKDKKIVNVYEGKEKIVEQLKLITK